jgi:hypothetical protein
MPVTRLDRIYRTIGIPLANSESGLEAIVRRSVRRTFPHSSGRLRPSWTCLSPRRGNSPTVSHRDITLTSLRAGAKVRRFINVPSFETVQVDMGNPR